MFCVKCGKEHQDDMAFCPYCGNPIGNGSPEPAPAPVYEPTPVAVKKSNKGALIAIIIIVAVLIAGGIIAAIFLLGGKKNPVDDYLNSPGFQEMRDLEEKMVTSYNGVTGANYVSDEQTLTEFTEHTQIYARDLYSKSVELASSISDEEVLSVHREYMNYANSYSQAIGQMIEALKRQDSAMVAEANKTLNEANNYALDFATDLRKLGEKYNVYVNASINTYGSDGIQSDALPASKPDRSKVLQFVLWDKLGNAEEGSPVTVNPEDILLDGNDVESAEATTQDNSITGKTENIIKIKFTSDGAKRFAEVTGEHVGDSLAIVSEGVLISAPNIREAITGGECIISGGFEDFSEAEELAEKLNG